MVLMLEELLVKLLVMAARVVCLFLWILPLWSWGYPGVIKILLIKSFISMRC
jgi:hypothetical protein